MDRSCGHAQPASLRIPAFFIGELAINNKQLRSVLVSDRADFCGRDPALEVRFIGKARLLLKQCPRNDLNSFWMPLERDGIDDDVAPIAPRKLPQLHEQQAARL